MSDFDDIELEVPTWPLSPEGLLARERWLWWDRVWDSAIALRLRYHLVVRRGWWENRVQVEAIAALAAWVDRYDSGLWDDPPGKLAVLYEIERVNVLLHDGADPFHPERDRSDFERYLTGELGCQPPPASRA